MQNITLTQN